MNIGLELDVDLEQIQTDEHIDSISITLDLETASADDSHESVILNTSNKKSLPSIKFCSIFAANSLIMGI
ncbi:unnamed protein product [Adineta steineri]|uniref:Uncharacterized protein n=1 Tax=Adineta steineri TaxID=433720 RepID=A0A815AY01_9BILA|nr:unnamed protein product [Adineta steineri]CAF3863522.1 unnamed protein product [Adineta steineri]